MKAVERVDQVAEGGNLTQQEQHGSCLEGTRERAARDAEFRLSSCDVKEFCCENQDWP
jgi:hypothetical protein